MAEVIRAEPMILRIWFESIIFSLEMALILSDKSQMMSDGHFARAVELLNCGPDPDIRVS